MFPLWSGTSSNDHGSDRNLRIMRSNLALTRSSADLTPNTNWAKPKLVRGASSSWPTPSKPCRLRRLEIAFLWVRSFSRVRINLDLICNDQLCR